MMAQIRPIPLIEPYSLLATPVASTNDVPSARPKPSFRAREVTTSRAAVTRSALKSLVQPLSDPPELAKYRRPQRQHAQ